MQEQMDVWPEDRVRAQTAAVGGRLRVRVAHLLAEFGSRRSTPLARQNVEQALREAGLRVEPSLQASDLDAHVTIFLPGGEDGEPYREPSAQAVRDQASRQLDGGQSQPAGNSVRQAARAEPPPPDERLPPRSRFPRPAIRPQTGAGGLQEVKKPQDALARARGLGDKLSMKIAARLDRWGAERDATTQPAAPANDQLDRKLTHTRARLQASPTGSERRLAEPPSEVETARRDVTSARVSSEAVTERAAGVERALETAGSTLSPERTRSADLARQIEQLERENDRDKSTALKAQVQALERRLAERESNEHERPQLEAQLSGTHGQVDQLRAESEKRLSQVLGEIETEREQRAAIEQRLDQAEAELQRERELRQRLELDLQSARTRAERAASSAAGRPRYLSRYWKGRWE